MSARERATEHMREQLAASLQDLGGDVYRTLLGSQYDNYGHLTVTVDGAASGDSRIGDYLRAAQPSVVQDLLTENEQLRAEVEHLRASRDRLQRAAASTVEGPQWPRPCQCFRCADNTTRKVS